MSWVGCSPLWSTYVILSVFIPREILTNRAKSRARPRGIQIYTLSTPKA
jgi:hypothetical protein